MEVEVLMVHLVVSDKKIGLGNETGSKIGSKIGNKIALEPVGGTGESDENTFVHGEPPGTACELTNCELIDRETD